MFDDSYSAENWFENMLRVRGSKNIRRETIKEYVKGGRWAYPKLYYCEETEAYLVTFWRNQIDQIKSSAHVSKAGKDLDERIKFTNSTFGENIPYMTRVCLK